MPTILRSGPYRISFFAGDLGEPPHVHVTRDACIAKFWLEPVALVDSRGFSERELRAIERLVTEHRDLSLRVWNAFFEGR